MIDILGELRKQLDHKCSDDSNLQHMLHMFEGYRSFVLREPDNPYSPDSARGYSWSEGYKVAAKDKRTAKS